MKTSLLLLLFIMLPSQGYGSMYKWTNEEGEIIYSDTPPNKDTEEILLPELNTTPAVKFQPKPEPVATVEDKAETTSYSEFKFVDPAPDAIIRDNTGNVPVVLSVQPALDTNAGHSISILLDGEIFISNKQQTSTLLSNIDRGTHTLSAEIRDSNGKVLTSSSASFTILRHSKLH
ncbi:MAG: DUF4124 domain-containing protein [Gammaproteobacteria bacterium]